MFPDVLARHRNHWAEDSNVASPQALLSSRQLAYLAVASLGLQAAGALQLNNASGLFKFLGASDLQVGWLWLIPPLAGLVVQPVLGQVSDLVDTRFGRRMPFILAGAVLSCLSMVVLSFSETLWLTVATMLFLSCSINCSSEGLRSLTGDIAPNQQKSKAFAWQAILGSIGAMLAGAIPWLLHSTGIFVDSIEAGFKIPVALKVSLFIGAVIVLQTVLSLALQIREGRPNDTEPTRAPHSMGKFCAAIFRTLYENIRQVPPVIRRMFAVQVLTWAGLFSVWIYFGLALAQRLHGLPPGVDVTVNPQHQAMLAQGVIQAGICFAISQLVGVLYALALPWLADRFDPNRVHALSLLAGGVSLMSLLFLHDIRVAYAAMVGLGLFTGSLNTLPYAIVASEIPPRKMGVCLGIFNITITLPQILCGLVISPLSRVLFANQAVYVIAMAGGLMSMAGVLLLRQRGVDLFLMFWEWLGRLFRNAHDRLP